MKFDPIPRKNIFGEGCFINPRKIFSISQRSLTLPVSTGAHPRESAHPISCVFCRKERMPGRERMNSRRIPSLIPIPIQWMNSGTLFLITATCGGRDRGASSVPASHMETGK